MSNRVLTLIITLAIVVTGLAIAPTNAPAAPEQFRPTATVAPERSPIARPDSADNSPVALPELFSEHYLAPVDALVRMNATQTVSEFYDRSYALHLDNVVYADLDTQNPHTLRPDLWTYDAWTLDDYRHIAGAKFDDDIIVHTNTLGGYHQVIVHELGHILENELTDADRRHLEELYERRPAELRDGYGDTNLAEFWAEAVTAALGCMVGTEHGNDYVELRNVYPELANLVSAYIDINGKMTHC